MFDYPKVAFAPNILLQEQSTSHQRYGCLLLLWARPRCWKIEPLGVLDCLCKANEAQQHVIDHGFERRNRVLIFIPCLLQVDELVRRAQFVTECLQDPFGRISSKPLAL
jgi:hypothetical protein